MKITDIAKRLDLDLKTGADISERNATGCYIGDMLSDVLAHAKKGDIWVTVQTHINIVSVAGMKEISGIIITNGRTPDETTLKRATEEKMPVFSTSKNAFAVAAALRDMGMEAAA